MTRLGPKVFIASLLLLPAGCTDRPAVATATASQETMDESADSSSTGEEESATGALEPCPEGYTRCGDRCTELVAGDAWNCGECGRACPLAEYSPGACVWPGECVPSYSPCVHPEDDAPHCDAVCNSVGQRCARESHTVWYSSQEGASCSYRVTGSSSYDAPCDAPFEWDRLGGFLEPVVGAVCICTNDF